MKTKTLTYHNETKDITVKFTGGSYVIIGDQSQVTDAELMAMMARDSLPGWECRDPFNDLLLSERVTRFNKRQGPRVGDYIELPKIHPKLGTITRITHDWGELDKVQTGGLGGSYYFHRVGLLDYSGGLDSGVTHADILPDPIGTRDGRVWFFDEDISGAGRGVYFNVPMRVFALRAGANLEGVGELQCPYYLTIPDDEMRERLHYNYRFIISKHCMSCDAFVEESEFRSWLTANQLRLTRPITNAQTLAYA